MKRNDWKSRGETRQEFEKSLGLPGIIWIHGHQCHHDLMRSNIIPISHNEYTEILIDPVLRQNYEVTQAIHPLSYFRDEAYQQVCDEFGYRVPKAMHEWNKYSKDELLELVRSWDWITFSEEEFKNGDDPLQRGGTYTQWYDSLFSDKIKYSDWAFLITGGRRTYRSWK